MKTNFRFILKFTSVNLIVAAIAVLLVVQTASAQLDSSFGTNGITVTNVLGNDRAIAAFVLPNDKTLVVDSAVSGSQTVLYLLRYNANGTLDQSYGTGGIVQPYFPSIPNAVFTKAVRLADGKIVMTGNVGSDSLVVKMNEDGTLDQSFAGGGIQRPNFNPNGDDKIDGLVLQPDGKFIVASYFTNYIYYYLYFARYLPNGTLDQTFGSDGTILHTSTAYASLAVNDLYLQSNGKIITKGGDIRRYNADGTVDGGFPIITIPNNNLTIAPLVVQPDDKILVVGVTNDNVVFDRPNQDVRVYRYSANGGLDASFGDGGHADVDITNYFDDTPIALAVQPDNQILVGCVTNIPVNRSATKGSRLSLARLSENGAVNGKFLVSASYPNYDGFIKIQPDGKILTIYGIYDSNFNYDLLLARAVGVPLATYRFHGIPFDFIYDSLGKAEVGVYRPSDGKWYFNQNVGYGYPFGLADDIRVPSDYTGAFDTEMAVFRPSNGTWYIARDFVSGSQNFIAVQFGQAGDVPVPADYDGDGKSDIAVWRPSNGVWYIRNSADNSLTAFQFGAPDDKPVAGDYDGDGKADVAVWRPSSGIWYIQKSAGGLTGVQFGASDDVPVQEDYDGDGKFDIAVWRPSNGVWYRLNSTDGTFAAAQWGTATDVLVPADYDGDLKTDVAVFRASDARWYILRSTTNAMQIVYWGLGTDLPLPRRQ